jgi:uncharacterized membrane protein YeaQ/YmgE (transglycosylase-associated protein family)
VSVTAFTWIAIGILLALLASKLGRMDLTGWLLNFATGVFGAVLGGWLFGGLGGTWAISPEVVSVSSLLGSLFSATTFLTVARLARLTG